MSAFQPCFHLHILFEVFEINHQVLDFLIALLAIFAQRFADQMLQLARHVGQAMRKQRRLGFQNRRNQIARRFFRERWASSKHFIKHYAQTPDVGARIYC